MLAKQHVDGSRALPTHGASVMNMLFMMEFTNRVNSRCAYFALCEAGDNVVFEDIQRGS